MSASFFQRFVPTTHGYKSALEALKRWRQPTITPLAASTKQYDYIIVGAGSAGCLLAERLSKDSSCRVLLIEAGPKDTTPWIHIPVGYFTTLHNPKYDWCFKTDPQTTGLNGKALSWPRGKVLGGSSSLNGLLYVRGQAEDYNAWEEQHGCKGWNWNNVSQAFQTIERHDHDTLVHSNVAQDYGTRGQLSVSSGRFKSELCDSFIDAAKEIGLPVKLGADINSNPDQEGVGYFLQSAQDGFRCSSAVAHLNQTFDRKNLDVIVNGTVSKVLFNQGTNEPNTNEQLRAVGVTLASNQNDVDNSNNTIDLLLDQQQSGSEIILSAGAIGSPHLLQLSGIGQEAVSNKIGVRHRVTSPGVGQNLQDHLQLRQVFKAQPGIPTLNTQLATYVQQLLVGVQYVANRTGPLSMAASQVCAFVKTRPEMTRPDVQFHLQPLSASTPGKGLDSYSAFTSSVCQLRPTSVGSIEVLSNNPFDAPVLCPNYLSTEEDQKCAVDALRYSRKLITETKAMANIVGQELRPGKKCVTDEELLVGAMDVAESIYHPAGTCKMGNDADSVVDERLRVRMGDDGGILPGLRVVDTSIMPTLVSGNTNGPTMMIAERASQMILEDRQSGGC
jgi:choline dehydrogenase